MSRKQKDLTAAASRTVLDEALRRCRGAFVMVGVFSCALNLLVLASPLYMLQVYDRVLSSGKAETLIMLSAMLAVALLAWAALETLRTSLTVRLGSWFSHTLGPHFMNIGIQARLNGENPGAQSFRDLSQIQNFLATNGMIAFFDMPWTPLFIAVIWLLHPWLGILALSAALLLLCLSILNDVLTRHQLRHANELQLASTQVAEATIRNAESVSAMGMGPAMVARWEGIGAASQEVLLKASGRGGLVGGTAKFVRAFSQSMILGLGAYLVIRGEATPGTMIAGSILLGRALAPVDAAMVAWKNFSQARFAYGRLKYQAEVYAPEKRRMSLPRPKGGLVVDQVTVVGRNGPLLQRVSFAAGPSEAVAIIGPSGAGKSTLCRAIVGLQPVRDGEVRIDGTNLKLWNRDELGQYVGYLPQDGGLFAGTILENIARMQEVDDDAVIDAARLAHAHELITQLPGGYETEIGDGGRGLSGGQRQRIGLARAVFGNPPLLVLDEPNANLDQAGESALAEAIFELKARGSTLVIVGHRPSTLAQADKVLLLQDGVVQDFGPRKDVLERMREAAQAQTAIEQEGSEEPRPQRGAASKGAPRAGHAPEAADPHEAPTLSLAAWRTHAAEGEKLT